MCTKLHTVVTSNNRDHAPQSLFAYTGILFNRSQPSISRDSTPQSLYYCLFAPHIRSVVLRAHHVHGESHIQRNANGEVVTEPINHSGTGLFFMQAL